jgi:PHD/YefM family antitoxin component YafN of YafNO toxin-antitoxin module
MSNSEPTGYESRRGRVVLWLLALGVPLLLLVVWWPAPPKPRPALPNPNGYDYFVKAGEALTGMWTNLTHHTLTASELQAFLAANQSSLELVREGLRYQSHADMDYDATYIEGEMTNLGRFKHLARLFAGEGWLAELEGRPGAAVDAYLDGMRFGAACGRGGVLIERLVAVAVENHSLKELRTLISKLDRANARRVLDGLGRIESDHDGVAITLSAEQEWVRQTASPWEQLMTTVHPVMRKTLRETRESLAQRVDTLQATRRRAIVEAAARLFELEKGRRPTGYGDLIPAYLPAAPLDPTTGKPIAHPF